MKTDTKLNRIKAALAACVVASGLVGQAQSYYDFDTGTDTVWLKSTNHPSTITYPADALGGKAYRLQGTPQLSGSDTNARVFCIFTNRAYTNFYAAVDVVSWNTNQDSDMVVGLMARVNGNNALPPSSFLYSTDPLNPDIPNGLSFNVRLHNKRVYAGPGNTGPLGAADQMSTWSLVNAFGTFYLGNPSAVTQTGFRWVPGHAYRLVLSCTNSFGASPTYFTCSIYDLNDLTTPLLTMTGDDSYNSNQLYIPQYGYVGIFAYKLANNDYDSSVDATFDNFYVGENPPATGVAAPAIPHGKIGAPQVVNRVPVSFKNFHPAASGISFNATTFTTTNAINTAALKLYLNGADVSAGLLVSGQTTNASVSYSGLSSNVVYDARIVVEDALGRRTTNDWTFDTFSDAYLASAAVKTIEAEDYDYNNGQYIDNPPASGYANYDAVNDTGTVINSGSGYVDQVGSNAKFGGSDYFDYDNSAHFGDAAYRHSDSVGTQQGNFGVFVYADALQTVLYSQSYENQRSKYSSLNPGLQEAIVERIEGGEWLNYTRTFDGTKTYNVYLRAACGLAQPVQLDRIAAGPTTNLLGRFNVASTFQMHNYRYTPLLTTNGSPASVNLSGVNTLRLTMTSAQNDAAKAGLALNYLVFVPAAPAAPKLYSSLNVNTGYAEETGAVVDTNAKTITVARSSGARFYRIAYTSQLTITSLSFSGNNVVLKYQ